MAEIKLLIKDRTPVYKQVVDFIESAIISGKFQPGEALPSLNSLAKQLDISPETAKKVYGILTRRGLLESHRGKGFFVRSKTDNKNLKVLLMPDKLGPYRQAFMNSFSATLGHSSEVHIVVHNQDIELFRYYIDQSLGKYDYYVVMPHFRMDEKTQQEVTRQLSRIPNRQLILADKLDESMKGSFGAVYQDFKDCVAPALAGIADELREYPCLDVFTMKNSLYGETAEYSIARFCDAYGIKASFHGDITENDLHINQVCLLLNSQADDALFTISEGAKRKGLSIGRDLKIISYNEYPLCGILFGGLTTISADFSRMGAQCAEMILSGDMKKIKCDIVLTRRNTF